MGPVVQSMVSIKKDLVLVEDLLSLPILQNQLGQYVLLIEIDSNLQIICLI